MNEITWGPDMIGIFAGFVVASLFGFMSKSKILVIIMCILGAIVIALLLGSSAGIFYYIGNFMGFAVAAILNYSYNKLFGKARD